MNFDKNIDIFSVLITLWLGRWRIIIIALPIAASTSFMYHLGPSKHFVAETNVIINAETEDANYSSLNNLGLFYVFTTESEAKRSGLTAESQATGSAEKVYRHLKQVFSNSPVIEPRIIVLETLFLDAMNSGQIFDDSALNLEPTSNGNEKPYNDLAKEMAKLKTTAKVTGKTKSDAQRRTINYKSGMLQTEFNDQEIWSRLIQISSQKANRIVQKKLINHFEHYKKDLKKAIQIQRQSLERLRGDAQKRSDFALDQKLLWLKRQAVIAKEVGLADPLQNAPQFRPNQITYLHGYKVIEKTIELLHSQRLANYSLINARFDRLTNEENETAVLSALEASFADSQIVSDKFQAGYFNTQTTVFKPKYGNPNTVILAVTTLSVILGALYVLISALISPSSYALRERNGK